MDHHAERDAYGGRYVADAGSPSAWYNGRMSTASLLDRFLDPVVEFLPPDAAQKIIDLRIDPELHGP